MDTTEHDVIKPEPEDDGGPLSNDGSSAGDGRGDGATTELEKVRPISREQLFSIAAASAFAFGVVWLSLKYGYHNRMGSRKALPMPKSFSIPMAIVIVVGVVAPLWAEMRNLAAGGFADKESNSKPLPELLLRVVVYLLTGVVAFALARLVAMTGGFTASPFTALMTAPAVVGSFMALEKKTTVQLTVIGIATVWLSLYVLGHSSPDLTPRSWVFGLIASAMLAIAGGLSYVRHTRDTPAEEQD